MMVMTAKVDIKKIIAALAAVVGVLLQKNSFVNSDLTIVPQ